TDVRIVGVVLVPEAIDEAIDARRSQQFVNIPPLALLTRPPKHLAERSRSDALTQLRACIVRRFLAIAEFVWEIHVAVRHDAFAAIGGSTARELLTHRLSFAIQVEGLVGIQTTADQPVPFALGIAKAVEHSHANRL